MVKVELVESLRPKWRPLSRKASNRFTAIDSIRFAKRVEKIRRIRRFQLESRDRRFDDTMMMNVITRNWPEEAAAVSVIVTDSHWWSVSELPNSNGGDAGNESISNRIITIPGAGAGAVAAGTTGYQRRFRREEQSRPIAKRRERLGTWRTLGALLGEPGRSPKKHKRRKCRSC